MKTWDARITDAEHIPADAPWKGFVGFTDEDRRDSGKWATCAVGEQHTKYPDAVAYEFLTHLRIHVPIDLELLALGEQFDLHVKANHVLQARAVYTQIQARVAALIAPEEEEAP